MRKPFEIMNSRVNQAMLFGLLGTALALMAWAQHSSPALAMVLPLLWALAPGRPQAFALTLAYHLTTVRFLPPYAGVWFESLALGVVLWLLLGLLCAATWTLLWPSRRRPWFTPVAVLGALVLTLASPIATFLPGHPIVGLGFLWNGGGWIAVAAFMTSIPVIAYALVHKLPSRWPERNSLPWIALLLLTIVIGLSGEKLDGTDTTRGRVAGRIGAIHTEWGMFPASDLESIQRVEKVGKAVASLAGGSDGFDTVVFPESIIGWYEPGLHAVIDSEILRNAKRTGQTVILGADIQHKPGILENIAIVFRPDGSSSYISARQTMPGVGWKPWGRDSYYPADWLGKSVTNVGDGINARIMICHEEYMPILHLLSEALEDQQLVIAIANRWASRNELATTVQSAHTEGMARLFARKWVRAENGPLPAKK